MTEPERLFAKHRANGLLIDTNLFLLLIVGSTNEQRIARFKRTQMYSVQDYRLLSDFAHGFCRIVTTPHVLAEVSNLAELAPPELHSLRIRFRSIVENASEIFEFAKTLMQDAAFAQLGLADTAIASAGAEKMLVLTDDLLLYRTLLSRGVDVLNFNHIRSL